MLMTRALPSSLLILALGCGSGEEHADSKSFAGTGGASESTSSTDTTSGFGGGAAGEACNGLDDNGDGQVDEGCTCVPGTTQPCFLGKPALAGKGACSFGIQTCEVASSGELSSAAWGACTGSGAPAAEACGNGIDDDCNGQVDEGCTVSSCVVGRTREVGCGGIFAWGDEHVTNDGWPAPEPFWKNAIGWLAKTGSCGVTRTEVRLYGTTSPELQSVVEHMGLTFSEGDLPSADEPPYILIVQLFTGYTAAQGTALHDWVAAGGAVMTMGVGNDEADECDQDNTLVGPFGLAYGCADPKPWGPVTSFASHPIAQGLTPSDVPFVNGLWVMETAGAMSSVVASVDEGACPSAP